MILSGRICAVYEEEAYFHSTSRSSGQIRDNFLQPFMGKKRRLRAGNKGVGGSLACSPSRCLAYETRKEAASANTLHSALPEMCRSPAQMAVIKVLLPSLEVFDLGAEISSVRANASAVLESDKAYLLELLALVAVLGNVFVFFTRLHLFDSCSYFSDQDCT